jgi:hypothetical protein
MKNSITRFTLLIFRLLLATLLFSAVGGYANATEPGSINGNVYCDEDKSGSCDCEEHGLKGIPVQIFTQHCGGVAIQSVATDEQGNFSFNHYEPGIYYIRVHLDYVCGGRKPTTSSCQKINLSAGEILNLPPFGYSKYGQG